MPSWAGACGTSAVAALPAPIVLVAQANLRPVIMYRTALLIGGSLRGAKSHAACQRASIAPRRAWACWPVGARCGCAGPFARTFSLVAKALEILASDCGYVRNVTFVARPGNRWMPNVSRSLAGSGNGEPAEHREDSSHALHALHLDFFPLPAFNHLRFCSQLRACSHGQKWSSCRSAGSRTYARARAAASESRTGHRCQAQRTWLSLCIELLLRARFQALRHSR
jgi:hypothetical protein